MRLEVDSEAATPPRRWRFNLKLQLQVPSHSVPVTGSRVPVRVSEFSSTSLCRSLGTVGSRKISSRVTDRGGGLRVESLEAAGCKFSKMAKMSRAAAAKELDIDISSCEEDIRAAFKVNPIISPGIILVSHRSIIPQDLFLCSYLCAEESFRMAPRQEPWEAYGKGCYRKISANQGSLRPSDRGDRLPVVNAWCVTIPRITRPR